MEIQTPRVFVPLLGPKRYKGAWGGRGSGKSHFFAEGLAEKAILQPGLRAVCIREVQLSLKQSVKRLIEDKIQALGVSRMFRSLETEIRTPGGGLIIFQGMQNHTADSIKSLEGYDVAWVEEAQALSERSLRLLRPTIRKPGSELWFSWNPESPADPVDELLRGPNALGPDMAAVVQANWRDNPWFPAVLDEERRTDLARRPDEYDHIWEGGYVTISDAIIFRGKVAVEAFETPPDARFFHGADWGFATDPTALVRSFIRDDCLFVDQEAFGHGTEIDALPALFDRISTARQWPIKADSARPETISYVARQGFRISAADKWQGSIEDGIAHLKGFRRIVVHPRCEHIAREFRLYSYKVDPKTEDVLPIIVDKHNHGIDALRYALDGYIKRRAPAKTEPLRL
ncbi:PBSX family phage terminase large subunit [Rhodovastum atsumiense]|uniref:PBSX family phage terminase large subunit n=1 Tax=Rhodovastum atsumiense TaxID=504468 RepID=A0A5M6IN58_9PROT|nr:PBSX family phage terminase large subunit [Rhodovastum atsumiense]